MQSEIRPSTKPWLKTGKQILSLGCQQVPTLVEPFIPKYGAMSLAGSSDLGKSYLLLQLSDAIINRREEFLGFPLNVTHGSVIYLSTEDDEYSLSPRLIKLSKGKVDTSAYDNLRVLFETTDLEKRIDMLLQEQTADVVIIDTFSDIFEGDMNQANKVRSFIQRFKEIAVKHKTLIIFNHHCGKKNDTRPPHKDNLLGSQGFESSMRTVIELRKDFYQPNVRHLCIVKGNYLGEEYKNSSFALDFNFENGFTNTGDRVRFERLVRVDDTSKSQERIDAEERVISLAESGLSINAILDIIKDEGYSMGRTTVGRICKAHRSSIPLPLGVGTNEQAAA